MKNPIFVKYNQSRAPKYQTKTVVYEDRGTRGVYKDPLTDAALSHVESFERKYKLTHDLFPNISFLKCKLEGSRVYYDYIVGKTLDDEIAPFVGDETRLVEKINTILNKYYVMNEDHFCKFAANEDYRQLFGDIDCDGMVCIKPVNLDMIFDNVMLVDGKAIAYDYEWVYDMALPIKYITYRVLSRVYDKYSSVISGYTTFEDFVEKFEISSEERGVFAKLEQALIANIYGAATEYRELISEIRKPRLDMETIKAKDEENYWLLEEIEELKAQKNDLNNQINNMVYSRSWKQTKWLRDLTAFAREVKRHGVGFMLKKDPYEIAPVAAELKRQKADKFAYEPLISVITPLFNTDKKFLCELIDSVIAQTYGNWELCFVDFSDEANQPRVEKIVRKYMRKDKRVLYERDANNRGIAENTNRVIQMAHGEYLALLDHDDVLHPYAFYKVVKAINDDKADFIYTDEVKFSKKVTKTQAPYYKPDFCADQLRTQNFICHLNVYKKSLLTDYNIHYDDSFNGSQDHDIVLRLTEKAKHIVHIPEVLYYWRVHAASVASNISAKPYCTTSGINAINAQYRRMGENLKVKSSYMNIPRYRVIAPRTFKEDVHVFIWGASDEAAINATVHSLQQDMGKTFEVTVLPEEDNAIVTEKITSILSSVTEPYVLFVRAGVTISTPRTISELMTYVRRLGVAAAECKVVTTDDKVFNGGIVCSNMHNPPVFMYGEGMFSAYDGYEAILHYGRAVSAVTGLCTLVSVRDYKKIKEGATRGSNPFIATSLHANECGMELFYTPYVQAKITPGQYRDLICNYRYDVTDVPARDPYFNDKVIKYRLI